MDYPFHPLRKGDPLPTESEIRVRMLDIKDYGLRHPIILFQGQILVGRTDYLACKRLGIAPRFVATFSLSDPQGFIITQRVRRGQQALPTRPALNNTPMQMRDREHEQTPPALANCDTTQAIEARQQHTVVVRKQVPPAAVHQNVHNLALRIGIRAAAREYGLKESRVLNWAWRDGWHIGKCRH